MTVTITLKTGQRFTMLNVTTMRDLRQRLQAFGITRVKGV